MTCNYIKQGIWNYRVHQTLFHKFWSCRTQDMDFIRFKPFFGKHFLKINSNPPPEPARCTRCSAPAATDERTRLPAGPAGQNAERGELRRAGAHRGRPLSTNQTALRVLRLKVNSANPFAWPETDRSKLATGHGEMAALLATVRPPRSGRACANGRNRCARLRRS
jgi:hypothetical protein